MKVSKSAADAVKEAMEDERLRACLNFQDYIAYQMQRDLQRAVKNSRAYHPDWTDEEIRLNILFGRVSDGPNGWYLRGVARRFSTGDVEEFALFIQMHVRQSILNHSVSDSEYIDVWTLLPAIAIRDELAIEQYIDVATYPLTNGHPDTRLIYNCVHALLRSDTSGMAAIMEKQPSKKTPAWLSGIIHCLQGIVSNEASLVRSGIEQHLAGYPRSFRIDPLEKLVSLESHGLYRLAERIDSQLVNNIDENRAPPWDNAFHALTSRARPTLAIDYFGGCPRELAALFVTLERPRWAE